MEMEHGMVRGETFDVYWSSDASVEKPVKKEKVGFFCFVFLIFVYMLSIAVSMG